jgi:Zn-finger nucleic acid-binding protein
MTRTSEVLDDFAKEFDRCWLCGVKALNTWPPRLEIHHMARGPSRAQARDERCALIRTCPRCHAERLDGMSAAKQLAIKRMADPAGYDRVALNRLRGRADEAVTGAEVLLECFDFEQHAAPSGFPFERWVVQ